MRGFERSPFFLGSIMENFFIEESKITQERFEAEFKNRRGEFENCTFDGIVFEQFNLSHYKFIDCVFNESNLSNCNFKSAVFRNAKFLGCKLVGINWTLLSNFGQLYFKDCILNYSVFQGMNLSKSKFLNCQLEETEFEEANLAESDFTSSCLLGSNFNRANLKSADFRKCTQLTIDLSQANIKGAKMNVDLAIELILQTGVIVE